MSKEMKLAENLLFYLNLLFAVGGFSLVIIGVYAEEMLSDVSFFVEETILAEPIILVTTGSVMLVVTLLGCCVVVRDSPSTMAAFAVLLVSLLAMEVTVAIVLIQLTRQTDGVLEENIARAVEEYNISSTASEHLDSLQQSLACCGAEGPGDWRLAPGTCCAPGGDCDDDGGAGRPGCTAALRLFVRSAGLLLGSAAAVDALLKIFGAVVGTALTVYVRRKIVRGLQVTAFS